MDHLTIARSPEIRKLSPAEPKMSYERLDCLSFAANFEDCGRNPCARHTGNVLRLSASKKKNKPQTLRKEPSSANSQRSRNQTPP